MILRNSLSNEMKMNINMFGATVECGILGEYKVVIPGGTGRSYGIRWRSGTRVTDETKGDGWADGWTDGRNV